MNFTVRTASRGDAALLHGMIYELAEYEKMIDMVTATAETLAQSIFDRGEAEALIAEADGKAVGYAIFCGNFSTFAGRGGLYIEDIYIKPDFRGKGFGKALFKAVAKLAYERGCPRMEWMCLDWNKPSIEFYERLGAKQLGEWTTFRLTRDKLAELLG